MIHMMDIFDSISLKSDRKIALDGIRTLWVKTSSQDICFYKGNQELEVKEYLSNRTEPAREEKKGDAFCLDLSLLQLQLIGSIGAERIELYVPENFVGQIYAESASGDISLDGQWNLENIQMVSASGDIRSGRLSAQHFLIKSKSGDITIEEANGDRQFSSVSGDVEIGCGDGDTKADTTSGDLQIEHISGAAVLKTVSGDLKVSFQKVAGDTMLSSVSGDIHVRTEHKCEFGLEVSTKSGDIIVQPQQIRFVNQQNHHVTALVGCDNEKQIETSLSVSTVSGDIVVSN
ncbi:MAG TPA: DUF4097 family beta strand repeat-containing protein [Lachnospiraceae bacterium]|nr:DUF4097 family beta strand repeat-containing protein [Lachnospiraceae bacterium]